jgi:hypothetical protein
MSSVSELAVVDLDKLSPRSRKFDAFRAAHDISNVRFVEFDGYDLEIVDDDTPFWQAMRARADDDRNFVGYVTADMPDTKELKLDVIRVVFVVDGEKSWWAYHFDDGSSAETAATNEGDIEAAIVHMTTTNGAFTQNLEDGVMPICRSCGYPGTTRATCPECNEE